MTALLRLYSAIMGAAGPILRAYLQSRADKGKEDKARLKERFGVASVARPEGKLIWLHGVSVGESLSALTVAEYITSEWPEVTVLLTSSTPASADIIAKRLSNGIIHQYAPIDTPQAIEAFLAHWRPVAAMMVESDIWPNWLMALKSRSIPVALISARITEKTFSRWQIAKKSMQHLLQQYALILPQDSKSEGRLRAMKATTHGFLNLKTIGLAPKADKAAVAALRDAIGERSVLVAASVHLGEEIIIAKASEGLLQKGWLLVLVPRHPLKVPEIVANLEAMSGGVARRSLGDVIDADTRIYVADTLGEMGTLLSLADLVFMGGSLLDDIGGHNPLEPARLGKGTITGPDWCNWATIFEGLQGAGGCLRVEGIDSLKMTLEQLSMNPNAVTSLDQAAARWAADNQGDLGVLRPFLASVVGPKP